MSYKIAIASSDGANVDQSFGEAEKILIYEVDAGRNFKIVEQRQLIKEREDFSQKEHVGGCAGKGCGGGCRGEGAHSLRAESLADCRCVVAASSGERIKKIFAGKGISFFDITGKIEEILEKILKYYERIDRFR